MTLERHFTMVFKPGLWLLVCLAGHVFAQNTTSLQELTQNTTVQVQTEQTDVPDDVTVQPDAIIAVSTPEPNGTCQEGPESGELPANQTCFCGSRGYFHGDACEYVNLTAADDINTSRRVMEIQWEADPEFSRTYAFLYRQLDTDGNPLGNPRNQSVDVKQGDGFFYAWLTYLDSDEVKYVVCVLESGAAKEISADEDQWSRIDAENQEDCVEIETEPAVSRELTMAAILVGGTMGVILIVVFTLNICNSRTRKQKVETGDAEAREMVVYSQEPQQRLNPRELSPEPGEGYTPSHMNDQIEYTPHSYTQN